MRSDVSAYFFGNALRSGISFVLVPVYVKLLSVQEFAHFGLLLPLYIYLQYVALLNLGDAVGRFFADEKDVSNHHSSKAIFSFQLLLAVVIILVLTILFLGIDFSVLGMTFRKVYYFVLITSLCNSLALSLYSWLRFSEKVKQYVVLGVFGSLSKLCLAILLIVRFHLGLNGILYSYLATSVTVAVISYFYILRGTFLSFDYRSMRKGLAFSAPIIPNLISAGLLGMSGRWILAYSGDIGGVAVYSLASQLAGFVSYSHSALNLTFLPRLVSEYNNNGIEGVRAYHKSSLIIYFLFSLLLSAGVVFVTIILVAFVFGLDYKRAKVLVFVLCLSQILYSLYWPFANILLTVKNTRPLMWFTSTAAVFNVAMNFLLVPLWGIWSVPLVDVASYLLVLLLSITVVNKMVGQTIPNAEDIKKAFVHLVKLGS